MIILIALIGFLVGYFILGHGLDYVLSRRASNKVRKAMNIKTRPVAPWK